LPPLKRNDETAAEVAAKQKKDEAKIAQLAADGVRPIHTVYVDGGQHPDFASLASYPAARGTGQGPVDVALNESKSKKARWRPPISWTSSQTQQRPPPISPQAKLKAG